MRKEAGWDLHLEQAGRRKSPWNLVSTPSPCTQWGDQPGQTRNYRERSNLIEAVKTETVFHELSVQLPCTSQLYAGMIRARTETLALESRLRDLGLATWGKNSGWPCGNSIEELESRAVTFEGVKWGNLERLGDQVLLFGGARGQGQDLTTAALFPLHAVQLQDTASFSSRSHLGEAPALKDTEKVELVEWPQEQRKQYTFLGQPQERGAAQWAGWVTVGTSQASLLQRAFKPAAQQGTEEVAQFPWPAAGTEQSAHITWLAMRAPSSPVGGQIELGNSANGASFHGYREQSWEHPQQREGL